jgi:hypothetical protein
MRKSFLTITLPILGAFGCNDATTSPGDAGLDMAHSIDPLAIMCNDTVDDVYKLPATALPAFDDTHRGDIFRCAFDRAITAAQINTTLSANGYSGPAVRSDVNVYRIAYRTARVKSTNAVAPGGYSSALVLMPSQRRSEAYVVAAHGTVGLADKCVPSLLNLTDTTMMDPVIVYNLALSGDGWATISPDYGGFGYGQTVSGWVLAEDEAHSVLDATRAMKNFLQASALPPKVALMGHSQGAHAVLAAQSYVATYGAASQVVGVAPMGVVWFSNRSWGASLSPVIGLTTTGFPGVFAFGLYYFYSHGENYDGPGGGVAMFQASKRDMVKQILLNNCGHDVGTALQSLGSKATDFYDPTFVNSVSNCMIFDAGCDQEPAKTWLARSTADRPAIDPNGPPILFWQGGMDTTVPPSRAQCGIDKINQDLAGATNPTASLSICGDAQATHATIIMRDIDYVSQWIAARATGQPDPPGCPGEGPLEPDTDGGMLTCAVPPPNTN